MSCPFVHPDVVRLDLSTGDYIDVKRELNAGEHRRIWAGMVRDGVTPGEVTKLNPERLGITRIMAYLVGWSYVDFDGRPVPVSEAAVLQFTGDAYRELATAIDRHESDQEARRELERKNPHGASGLRAIS